MAAPALCYNRMTNRAGVADAAQKYKSTLLTPDDGRPEDMYTKIVEIDLDTLEPHLSMWKLGPGLGGVTIKRKQLRNKINKMSKN